jgi:hypothetical protein
VGVGVASGRGDEVRSIQPPRGGVVFFVEFCVSSIIATLTTAQIDGTSSIALAVQLLVISQEYSWID